MLSSASVLVLLLHMGIRGAAATANFNNFDGSAADFNASCAALANSIHFQNVTVNFAQFVAAASNLSFPDNDPSCNRPFQIIPQDLCRIASFVETSSRSGISLETWLPRNWTGRFLSTGNGGISGCIQYEDIAYGINNGFAAVGANGGHNGSSGVAYLNNSEVVADFGYRSVHTGVVVGKQITKLFYSTDYTKSYYLGCSTGGRQGIQSALLFPQDFDGIVAGSPALDFNNLNSWSDHFYPITGNATSPRYLSPDLWTTVHTAILDKCDDLDNYVDGIIEDPDLCTFDANVLLCASGETSNCLTSAQVQTVNKALSPLIANGTFIYPRMQPGTELNSNQSYYSGRPSPFIGWYQYVILSNPDWDPATLDDTEIKYAYDHGPSDVRTWSGDLSGFSAAGGKLLHYHGLQDPIITSDNSERFYKLVSKTLHKTSDELDEFYRYFRISGMGHCNSGPGAWQVGQTTKAFSEGDPQDNVLLRIVDWVENGAAPTTIRGTKYVNDTVSLGVSFQRDHCKFPKRNVYKRGDPTKPESWACQH